MQRRRSQASKPNAADNGLEHARLPNLRRWASSSRSVLNTEPLDIHQSTCIGWNPYGPNEQQGKRSAFWATFCFQGCTCRFFTWTQPKLLGIHPRDFARETLHLGGDPVVHWGPNEIVSTPRKSIGEYLGVLCSIQILMKKLISSNLEVERVPTHCLQRLVYLLEIFCVASMSGCGGVLGMFASHINRKNPHAHENKIGTCTPPPSKKPHHPPPNRRNFMGTGNFQQKEQKNARRP